ncbi:MAG: hypothetical protein ACLPX8_12520 [Bryobacteraceae bacterium]|jgi:hypothetical protein
MAPKLTRRTFLETATAVPALAQARVRPKRIAIVATIFRLQSHAQHIGDRFIVGYPFAGEWHKPNTQVVSMYVDQKPANDLSGDRARDFGFEVYPTIAGAMCCGGSRLAVDAVLIIGEHGEYPRNEKGQVLYPRYEFFDQVAKVFEAGGRAVPVYNDKALSYSFEKARTMRDTARRLKFPMLAGSSLPVTWRLPELELPLGCEIDDALMVGTGGSDAMDFHALEAMQCMLERRKGGERGVKSVQLIEGDAVWQAGEQGRWSKDLLRSALSRSDNLKGLTETDGRTQDMVGTGVLPTLVKDPWAYFIEYRDGLKATLLMLTDAVGDFNFAVKLKGQAEIQATQFFLSPDPNVTYSACLASKIERMIETGVAPYAVERTLLVSGILESCLDSRVKGHALVETPHLAVAYQAPRESQFCRS